MPFALPGAVFVWVEVFRVFNTSTFSTEDEGADSSVRTEKRFAYAGRTEAPN